MDTTVILFKRSISDRSLYVISSVKCNDSVSFSFFACLLAFFFFINDQIASVKLKQIEGSAPCVIHSYMVVVKFNY